MRFELAGSIVRPEPLVLSLDAAFIPEDYIDQGYTHFDVICIGGGGGRGGGVDTANTGTLIRNYGGEGGGGGFQRVQGLLSALPSSCPVVVGAAGAPGTERPDLATLPTTDGGDGTYSSFNGTTCRASGGKGGKRATMNSTTAATGADGGEGGVGNRTAVGGGAAGGVCGDPDDDPSTSTDGEDGPILTDIGHGGGGGAGGIAQYGGTEPLLEATAGGRGSYSPDDIFVFGVGEDPKTDPGTGLDAVKPGRGGGATASPLNRLSAHFGRAGSPGAVIIRLTAK